MMCINARSLGRKWLPSRLQAFGNIRIDRGNAPLLMLPEARVAFFSATGSLLPLRPGNLQLTAHQVQSRGNYNQYATKDHER